eukprot:TRINITY_DN2284_c0_g1_i2.p1 TRINITY_DN2284_c0_g1~~TRINITY_DN2284_c0_g1_i2.p1  ORF type:complete len:249 (+),score=62.09 TRINITY_DN2284_c0_g1_i2:49-747(+)
MENGDLFSFGENDHGQCGKGDKYNIITPIKIMNNPNVMSIILGKGNSFLLEKNGDLYACGGNEEGRLGTGNNDDKYTFIKVESNVKCVCASYHFTLIQKDDGNVYFSGKCEKMGLESKVFTLIEIQSVTSFSCGRDHAIFIDQRGEVWGMGSNEYGQLGIPKTVKEIKTKPLLLLKSYKGVMIACGLFHVSKSIKNSIVEEKFVYLRCQTTSSKSFRNQTVSRSTNSDNSSL